MRNPGFVAVSIAAVAVAALSSCGDSGVARLAGSDPGGIAIRSTHEPLSIGFARPHRNLLPNGSFERDGQPSLDGWRVNNPSLTSVVAEPAPGGGGYSLKLEADWAPTTGYITAPIPAARRGGVFRLSAYVRAVDADGGGTIALAVGKSYQLTTVVKSAYSTATDWTRVTLEDTVGVADSDTLWVVLSSFHTEITRRQGLFDRVVLERVRRGDPGGRVMPE